MKKWILKKFFVYSREIIGVEKNENIFATLRSKSLFSWFIFLKAVVFALKYPVNMIFFAYRVVKCRQKGGELLLWCKKLFLNWNDSFIWISDQIVRRHFEMIGPGIVPGVQIFVSFYFEVFSRFFSNCFVFWQINSIYKVKLFAKKLQ